MWYLPWGLQNQAQVRLPSSVAISVNQKQLNSGARQRCVLRALYRRVLFGSAQDKAGAGEADKWRSNVTREMPKQRRSLGDWGPHRWLCTPP